MRIVRASVVIACVVAGWFALSPLLYAQADPLIGHWMLNVAKSKYSPGPAPKSEMRVYEAFGGAGKGIKGSFDRVDAAGRKVTVTFSAMYDGKDYQYNGPDADMVALTRPNPNTVSATLKLKGKVVQTTTAVISPDGKTRTQTVSGTDSQGQKISITAVFDKQG